MFDINRSIFCCQDECKTYLVFAHVCLHDICRPALVLGELCPIIVVLCRSTHVHHVIDARGAAEKLASWDMMASTLVALLPNRLAAF